MSSIKSFIEGHMTGNAWEDLCVRCYRIRYQKDNYTAIPATQGGDAGIEGFTYKGVVHQCYCPERDYSDNELYEHQRNKLTADIEKLKKNADRLKALGVPPVVEWHFNIPEYKDTRILAHYDSISNNKTLSEDYYVNIQNSATSEKGFHTFLEEFLHMELPLVRTSDGNERKLYLQMIFASMFIEQKHGWSDILSGMPVFGIRESKKRIVEYILGLDTLKNEKERDRLNAVRSQLEYKWGQLISDFEKAIY